MKMLCRNTTGNLVLPVLTAGWLCSLVAGQHAETAAGGNGNTGVRRPAVAPAASIASPSLGSLVCAVCAGYGLDCAPVLHTPCPPADSKSTLGLCIAARARMPNGTAQVQKGCAAPTALAAEFPPLLAKGLSQGCSDVRSAATGYPVKLCICTQGALCNAPSVDDTQWTLLQAGAAFLPSRQLAPLSITKPAVLPAQLASGRPSTGHASLHVAQGVSPGQTNYSLARSVGLPHSDVARLTAIDAANRSLPIDKHISNPTGIVPHAILPGSTANANGNSTLVCMVCGEGNLTLPVNSIDGSELECRRQYAVDCAAQYDAGAAVFCFTRHTKLTNGKHAIEKLCVTDTALVQEYGPDTGSVACDSAWGGQVRYCVCDTSRCNQQPIEQQWAEWNSRGKPEPLVTDNSALAPQASSTVPTTAQSTPPTAPSTTYKKDSSNITFALGGRRCHVCGESDLLYPDDCGQSYEYDCARQYPTAVLAGQVRCLTRLTKMASGLFTIEKRCITEPEHVSQYPGQRAVTVGCGAAWTGTVHYCICDGDLCNEPPIGEQIAHAADKVKAKNSATSAHLPVAGNTPVATSGGASATSQATTKTFEVAATYEEANGAKVEKPDGDLSLPVQITDTLTEYRAPVRYNGPGVAKPPINSLDLDSNPHFSLDGDLRMPAAPDFDYPPAFADNNAAYSAEAEGGLGDLALAGAASAAAAHELYNQRRPQDDAAAARPTANTGPHRLVPPARATSPSAASGAAFSGHRPLAPIPPVQGSGNGVPQSVASSVATSSHIGAITDKERSRVHSFNPNSEETKDSRADDKTSASITNHPNVIILHVIVSLFITLSHVFHYLVLS